MTKVLIADDHPVVRNGLKAILTAEMPGVLCGEASNGQEVLEQAARQEWDVVILDIAMPGRNGLEALKELKQTRPKLPVLVLSNYPEEQYGRRTLLAGASGYMTKESAAEELVGAIRRILAGRKYVSPAMAESLAEHLEPGSEQSPHERLSNREIEVLRLLGSGKTARQIAWDLHLGLTTISTYRARILTKLGMKTTAELIHYAIGRGLAD